MNIKLFAISIIFGFFNYSIGGQTGFITNKKVNIRYENTLRTWYNNNQNAL